MAQEAVLESRGLYSAQNPYSGVPDGALVKADNAVVRFGRIESRRGRRYWEGAPGVLASFGIPSSRSNEGYHWGAQGTVFHYDTSALARVVPGAGVNVYSGSYTPVDAATLRMKFVEAAQNLYFNTNAGVYLLESITGTPALAGVPRALGLYGLGGAYSGFTGSAGWMAPNTAVRYFAVWGRKDSHDNVVLGAPSEPIVMRNVTKVAAGSVARVANVVTVTASGTNYIIGDTVTLLTPNGTFGAGPFTITAAGPTSFSYAEVAANNVSAIAFEYGSNRQPFLGIRIPPNITTAHFLRLYRSEQSPDADIEPSEDVYLVNERLVTAPDLVSGFMPVFTDTTPEAMLQTPAYFNPNDGGDGALSYKYRPPMGKDMCLWDQRMWCFNTVDLHRFFLTMLGIGTPDGVQNNDTITIGATTYTFKTTPVGANDIQIYTDLSPSQNTERTARVLIYRINANAATTGLVAYYVSGPDDGAGQMLVESVAVGGAAFAVYASRPASWSPGLTTSSSGAKTSVNDARTNGASYSTEGEPEAFPVTNWFPLGSKSSSILRAVPFRDKLFVLTDNRKAYTISGPAPYRVDEIDSGAMLLAADTVCLHNNQVFALTDQGVGVLSDAGFRIVSRPIEDDLLDVLAIAPATLKRYAFALSYEEEHQYQVWVPMNGGATFTEIGFVYNSLENAWTTESNVFTWGRVNDSDGKLYFGDGLINRFRQERKSFDRTDYADLVGTVTIVSHVGLGSVTLASASGVGPGMILWQGSTSALVTAKNGNTLTVVGNLVAFNDSTANVDFPITTTLKYAPIAPGGPCQLKDYADVTFHFREYLAYVMRATFDTETYSTEGVAVMQPVASYEALTPLPGADRFSGPPVNRNRRVEVTQNHVTAAQLRVGLTISEAWVKWSLHGFTVNYEASGDAGRP